MFTTLNPKTLTMPVCSESVDVLKSIYQKVETKKGVMYVPRLDCIHLYISNLYRVHGIHMDSIKTEGMIVIAFHHEQVGVFRLHAKILRSSNQHQKPSYFLGHTPNPPAKILLTHVSDRMYYVWEVLIGKYDFKRESEKIDFVKPC